MASPNVKVDKSVKIRRRNTLPGPLYKIRHQTALLQKRHTSGTGGLPSSISSRCPSILTTCSSPNDVRWHHLHQSKTNPYVGWFRHAPSLTTTSTVSLPKILSNGIKVVNVDTLWLRDWLVDGMAFHQDKKRKIIVKDHNFTQFKYQQDKIKSTLFLLKQVMGNRTDTRDLNLDLLLLYKRRSGHLRGGGTDDGNEDKQSNELDDTTIEQYLQRQYASSTESITIKALSRIACWLLDIPVHSTTAANLSCKENHLEGIEEVGSILSYDDDDDETRSVCSYDNHDTISGSRFRTSMTGSVGHGIESIQLQDDANEERYPVGYGLSSQAEAYYALGAVYRHILAENIPNMSSSEMSRRRADSLDDIDRLDYEITQMDIVRMNRIASRHLDVESIVRLPVLTYQQKNVSTKPNVATTIPTIPEDREPTISSSRPEDRDIDNIAGRQSGYEEEEKHDAEFSWMLVPPTHDDSFGSSSVEQYAGFSGYHSEHGRQQEEDVNDNAAVDVCVICLESFIPGDRLRVLPCTHSFHVGCIDRWLSGSHSFYDCYTAGCPTCKVRPDTAVGIDPNSPPPPPQQQQRSIPAIPLHESDGSVPSWAMARIGHILAHESQHF